MALKGSVSATRRIGFPMRLAQWYAEREAQAGRRADWHKKLAPLGAVLRRYAETMKPDPVTKSPMLTVTELHGPQDALTGYRVDVFNGPMLTFKLSDNADVVNVSGFDDQYPNMKIRDIAPASDDDVQLHFTRTRHKVDQSYSLTASALIQGRLEDGLHA